MRNSRLLRIGIICLAVMFLTTGCISYSRSRTGEKEFWMPWLAQVSPSSKGLSANESWEKFEGMMRVWLTKKLGKLTEDEAQYLFSKPTQRRVTEWASSDGWHASTDEGLSGELLVVSGSKGSHFDYIMVLGFNPNGILKNFEIASSRNPSITIGGTTKHLVEGAVAVGSMVLFSQLMEQTLRRAGDHLTSNFQGLEPGLEQTIQKGVQGGIQGGVEKVIPNVQTAIETGTQNGLQFMLPNLGTTIKNGMISGTSKNQFIIEGGQGTFNGTNGATGVFNVPKFFINPIP